jgi:hypothetical protein
VQLAECEMIRDFATDPKKRELFTGLAEHFRILAAELERALAGRGHKIHEPHPDEKRLLNSPHSLSTGDAWSNTTLPGKEPSRLLNVSFTSP